MKVITKITAGIGLVLLLAGWLQSCWYILKPTMGLIVNDEAADPVDPEGSRFPNAVTSDKVDDTGSDYMFAFLSLQYVHAACLFLAYRSVI